MKRTILALVAILGLASVVQAESEHNKTFTLASRFDLDGAAASVTAIVGTAQIVDGQVYTIAAQPDTPRPLAVTVVDADSSITACTLTVVGTAPDGRPLTSTTSLAGGSGVKVLSPNSNFATVTSVSNGTCTGEGGAADTLSLGTTSTIPPVYFMQRGSRRLTSQGTYAFGLDWLLSDPNKKVVSNPTNLSCVNPLVSDCVGRLGVGDIVQFQINGEWYERGIAIWASASDADLDAALVLPATGLPYRYHKLFLGTETNDSVIPVGGFDSGSFIFLFTQTGDDMKTRVQCRVQGAGNEWVLVDNTTIAATAALVSRVVALDFRLTGYDECRVGLEWATNDAGGDAAGELEIITIQFTGTISSVTK